MARLVPCLHLRLYRNTRSRGNNGKAVDLARASGGGDAALLDALLEVSPMSFQALE
jgi:hypothetical protein